MTPEKKSWLPLTEIQASISVGYSRRPILDKSSKNRIKPVSSPRARCLRKAKLDAITGATLVIFHCTLGIFAKYAFEEDWLFFSNFSAHFNP